MSRARRRTVKALGGARLGARLPQRLRHLTERQALNTDDWVDTSGRLIQNETVRAAVGEYLIDQLYENVDVEKNSRTSSRRNQELAGPVSGGLRQVAAAAPNRC
jgi:hypothetical protein